MSEKRVLLPSISYIVARSSNGHVIGSNNEMPWRLKTDLKRFRQYTGGHAVIMGRKTFESIGKPLPNRINIVLSRKTEHDTNEVIWAPDPQSALYFADVKSLQIGKGEFFVIGGSEVFNIYMRFFNKIYLTEIFGNEIVGDTHFKCEFDLRKWSLKNEEDVLKSDDDQYGFRINTLLKKDRTVRSVLLSDFMTNQSDKKEWLLTQQIYLGNEHEITSQEVPDFWPSHRRIA